MKRIPLHGKYANGRFATVDDADYERVKDKKWVYTLTRNGKPYVITAMEGSNVYMHRFILDAKPGEIVDHKNADTLDNRRSNIRIGTQRLNLVNKRVFNSTMPYRGVILDKDRQNQPGGKCYRARIKYYNQTINLSRYTTAEEAAYVYDQVALQLNGGFALLNVLEV